MNSSIFKKIAEAQVSQSNNYIREGSYLFTVTKIVLEEKRKGPFFIAEFLVEEAKKVTPDVEPNAVGSTCSIAIGVYTDMGPGLIKKFILGLLGAEDTPETAAQLEATLGELVSSNQPGKGLQVRCQTYKREIQKGPNAGKPFIGHNWQHVPQTPEEVAARRAALEKKSA